MPRTNSRIIIAHHLVMMLYGHWLPNDLRGSGSTEIRIGELEDLGPIHFGRKRDQPSRKELKDFYRRAEPKLEHDVFWIDPAKRQAIADALRQAATFFKYTVWACAICSNHAHLVVRRHRDHGDEIWRVFTNYARDALRNFADVGPVHPVWSDRPYVVFLYYPPQVVGRIDYVRQNPIKEGLPPQHYDFVQRYDGWPYPGGIRL